MKLSNWERPTQVFLNVLIVFVLFSGSAFCQAQTWTTFVGWDALNEQFGSTLANGTDVIVSQVEAPAGNGGFQPDPTHSQFANPDKIFMNLSGLNNNISGHATAVGRNFYGRTQSIAGGVIDVKNYEVNHWINVATGIASGVDPQPQPFHVQNHSWVGGGLSTSVATQVLTRIDFMVNQNDLNLVVGVSNTGALPQLLAPGINLLSVGRTDGSHSDGLTTFYTPGRVKPEIVLPATSTSNATGRVSGAVAMMRDAARGTAADHNEAIRALILAGATKTEFPNWNRTTVRPLDTQFGIGELNIYNSYHILLAGETDGSPSTPTVLAGPLGWDYGTIQEGQTLNYQLELTAPADHVSVALTWNIDIVDTNPSPSIFAPQTTLGNLDLFFVGNGLFDTSVSNNHNIEHVYLRDVPAGVYNIALTTNRTTPFGLAWRAALIQETANQVANLVTGKPRSGSAANLASSDDQYFRILPARKTTTSPLIAVIEFESNSPFNMPNSIQFDLESSSTSANIEQQIEIFDFVNSEFVLFQTSLLRMDDSIAMAYALGELTNFVEAGTNRVRARVSWQAVGPVFQFPWTVNLDHAVWNISQ